jgi:hypothetical protein
VISVAQVVTAMAAGALLPVVVLLTIEVRARHGVAATTAAEGTASTPGRVVDDDRPDRDWQIEAVAQLAAARFDRLDQADDNDDEHTRTAAEAASETRPRGHLTLIPTARDQPLQERSSVDLDDCQLHCDAHHPYPARIRPPSLTRD